MDIHKKQKGNLGAIKIIGDLIQRGCEVFTEFGDNSRVDLIALIEKKTIRIQVKSITSENGAVRVSALKKGPNYSYRYEKDDCDLFAVYVLDKDILFYLLPEQLLKSKSGITIRLTTSKNGQTKNIHKIEDFQKTWETLIRSL